MKKRLLASLLIINSLLVALLFYAYKMAEKLPDSRPETYLDSGTGGKTSDTITVVHLGDSITQGAMSADYIEILSENFSLSPYSFVNAGMNGELAWNALRRVDSIIACDPDYITILIGSNDVLASLSKRRMDQYKKNQGIPEEADLPWFEENLRKLIKKLRNSTDAEIAILSLPPITEDPSQPGYIKSKEYSDAIKKIASETDISYLPLHEEMEQLLRNEKSPPGAGIPFNSKNYAALNKAVVKHYILKKSWNEISEENGLILLTDNIHLNDRAAGIISGLIKEYLISHPPSAH